ncbi:Putative S-adenosyl-L-methionine-dependent methyltransferase superfamily [Colletotrichum destructivum]|uniref:S-adenosyl-L-methionine-dependent methyltransferase superfamily n=1 Tax=Colletotrichum destructivum TaxID=34406 RepID=A0AAX4I1M0_9PEZI|nr:Putative S-adenosyl-L-methionine-dependent methyltransferase superfamily [Colletotrichum destructivum]
MKRGSRISHAYKWWHQQGAISVRRLHLTSTFPPSKAGDSPTTLHFSWRGFFFDNPSHAMADYAHHPAAEDVPADDDSSSVSASSVDDSLVSLRSSILDYRRENGRTYHRLSDGKYMLPNDEKEQDRLDLTHHLWLLTWDDALCKCPKKDGAKRVLDIGTGTGIWALDYADEHPEAIVLGVDLSPIQPDFVPPNCSFEVDDVEKDWTWVEPFDFIFIRSMIASFSSWPDILAKAYQSLEPGGYLELHDHMLPLKCQDGTMAEDFKPYKWNNLLIEATNQIGRPINVPSTFKQMLEDAGFVDVEERIVTWPFNPWPKDPKLRDIGFWAQETALAGIEAVSMALFTRVLDWAPEEAWVFCAEVRNEHKKIGVHAYYDVYGVWGRKPEEEKDGNPEPGQA